MEGTTFVKTLLVLFAAIFQQTRLLRVSIFMVLPLLASAQPYTWTTNTPMPTARFSPGGACTSTHLYVTGGAVPPATKLTTHERYTLSTDTWTTLTAVPILGYYNSVATAGDLLALLGWDGGAQGVVHKYTFATDAWATATSMPTSRYRNGWVNLGAHAIAIGGAVTGPGLATLTTVETYQFATDTWLVNTPMPTTRTALGCGFTGTHVLVAGGYQGVSLTTLEIYTVNTDTWTTGGSDPATRFGGASVYADGHLYCISGRNPGTLVAVNSQYNAAADTWTTSESIPTQRKYATAACTGTRLYLMGGDQETAVCSQLEAFTLSIHTGSKQM